MADIRDTDRFLVNRSNKSYQLQSQNLMAELQDDDLMLVNRDGQSYRATGKEIKESIDPLLVPPVLDSVSLLAVSPDQSSRFTDKSFDGTTSLSVEGRPQSTKTIDAFVEGKVTTDVETDTVSSVSTGTSTIAARTWSNFLSATPGDTIHTSNVAGRAFDGSPTSWASTQQNDAGLIWDSSSFAFSGNLSVKAGYVNTSTQYRTKVTVTHSGGTDIKETQVGDEGVVEFDGLKDITRIEIKSFDTGQLTILNEIYLNGEAFIDGQALQRPLNTCTFTTDQDIEYFEKGDLVNAFSSTEETFEGTVVNVTGYQGNAYSDTATGQISSFQYNYYAFDGSSSTKWEANSTSTDLTWECAPPLYGKIRLMSQYTSVVLTHDGGETTVDQSNSNRYDFWSVGTFNNVTKMVFKGNSGKAAIYQIEVNGKVLKDYSWVYEVELAPGTDMSKLKPGDIIAQPSAVSELPATNWTASLDNPASVAAFDGNLDSYIEVTFGQKIEWTGSSLLPPGEIGVVVHGYKSSKDRKNSMDVYSEAFRTPSTTGSATPYKTFRPQGSTDSNAPGELINVPDLYSTSKIVVASSYSSSTGAMVAGRWYAAYFNGQILIDNQPLDLGSPAGYVSAISGTTVYIRNFVGVWLPQYNLISYPNSKEGTVESTNAGGKQMSINMIDNAVVEVGDIVRTGNKTLNSAKRYLKFDQSGNVSGLLPQPQSPAWTSTAVNPSITLNFPSYFNTGQEPDQEIDAGCSLTISCVASNSAGSSGPKTASVTPSPSDIDNPEINAFSSLVTLYEGKNTNTKIINNLNTKDIGALVCIKSRDSYSQSNTNFRNNTAYWYFTDTIQGTNKQWSTTNNKTSETDIITSFNDDGFSIGTNFGCNRTGERFVAYSFRQLPGLFDMVLYEGNGTSLDVNHNLGVEPGVIWLVCTDGSKPPSDARQWHHAWGTGMTTIGRDYGNQSNDVKSVSATTFTVGGQYNYEATPFIAYLWPKEVANKFKSGSYVGNGSATNTISLGFAPQLVVIKSLNNGYDWAVFDTKRGDNNLPFYTNRAEDYYPGPHIDFTANGFTLKGSDKEYNESGKTYAYWAYADAPSTYSMTEEELKQQTLKFATYDNRKEVYCGEVAQARRDELKVSLLEAGYTEEEINEPYDI